MPEWVHPAAILILGSVLVPLFRGPVRSAYLLLLPLLAVYSVFTMSEGVYGIFELFGQSVVFGRVDKLSLVFGYVFSIAAFISVLYALKVRQSGHHVASLVYAGGALGVTFAGDFITLFVFWEFMAFSSVFLILFRKCRKSYDAAYRYVLVHVFGGVMLLGGFVLLYKETGSFAFELMELGSTGTWLILVGFMVNAAVIPFNAWLPDAYPRATVAGAVFLSAFTTKSAIYVLARGFAGTEILIWFGVAMALYGVIYAVLENDIRRVQAYSIVSQLGYMVTGIGIGTHLALNGVVSHAFAHILYKGLLFMATGAVLYMTAKSKMTELGGLRKYMPYTFVFYMVGALAISGFPLFSGFISKSLIISAAGEEHMMYPSLLLTLAAAGTFLYTGLKLPYLVFFGKDRFAPEVREEGDKVPADPPTNMLLAMAIAAALCIILGISPNVLYHELPFEMHYLPYTAEHVIWSLELLLFAGIGFMIFHRTLAATRTINIDTDWLYRLGGRIFMWVARRIVAVADDAVNVSYMVVLMRPMRAVARRSLGFDQGVIDAVVNGVAGFFVGLGTALRRFQTGQMHDYALSVLIGVLVLLTLFILII